MSQEDSSPAGCSSARSEAVPASLSLVQWDTLIWLQLAANLPAPSMPQSSEDQVANYRMNIISLLYFRCIQKVLYWPSTLRPNTSRSTKTQCKQSQTQRRALSSTSNNTDRPELVTQAAEPLCAPLRCWTRFRISLYAVGASCLIFLFLTSCLVT